MKRRVPIFLVMLMSLFVYEIFAQHFDYRLEEAPVVSWNSLPLFDARLMALGGISLTASGPFTAALNPALIPSPEKVLLGISFGGLYHEAFQYWGVNQGVKTKAAPLSNRDFLLSGLAVAFKTGDIRLSTGWYLSALREFPSFTFRQEYEYDQYDAYSGNFSGRESTFFAAAALKLTRNLDIGLKLAYISGQRQVDMIDFSRYYYLIDNEWQIRDLALRQHETHERSSIAVSLGAALKISPHWTVGAAFVYPFQGKVKRTVTRIFDNQTDQFDITDRQTGTDTLYQPAEAVLGTTINIPLSTNAPTRKQLLLGAEAAYTSWSGYKYVFFGDTLPRDMRDTVALALGAEYGSLSANRDLFFRLGFRLDPQPLREPATTLKALTAGLGLRLGSIGADVGAAYYSGSANGVRQNHFSLNTTLHIRLTGGEQ